MRLTVLFCITVICQYSGSHLQLRGGPGGAGPIALEGAELLECSILLLSDGVAVPRFDGSAAVAIVPAFPFFRKSFAKGIVMGAVKG